MPESKKRKGAKEHKPIVKKRNLTPEELFEFQELNSLVGMRKFEAAQVKANTAMVPNGQVMANQLESISLVLDNVRNQWVAQKLVECGYPLGAKCTVNRNTGVITEHK